MNFKVTLVLLILVLAGFAAFYVTDRGVKPADPTDSAAPTSGAPLWPGTNQLPSERIGVVTIQTPGKTYEFARDAAPAAPTPGEPAPQPQWNQTKPVTFPVNGYRINSLVGDVYAMRYSDKFTPGAKDRPSLEDAGLAKDFITLTLAPDPNPSTTKPASDRPAAMSVKLGKTTIAGRAYAMINDDPQIYVVRDDVHKAMGKANFDDYRQTTLVAPVEGRAQKVELSRNVAGAATQTSMSKRDGRWTFDSPLAGRVDREQVSSVLSAVSSFSASNFISEAPERLPIFGLDSPTITLTVHSPQPQGTGETTCTLRVGNSADLTRDNFYATWSTSQAPSPVVFTVPKTVFESLNKVADNFRDKRLAPIAAADVVDFTVERGGETIGFTRSPSGWTFSPPNPLFAAESSSVAKIVNTLIELSAEQFVGKAPAAGAKPVATVKITATGQPEADVLRFFPEPADSASPEYLVAYRNNEAIGYAVPASKLANVFIKPVDVRSLSVLNIDPDALTRVTLQQPGAEPLTFERAPAAASQPTSSWKLRGQSEFESVAFGAMVKAMLPLKAEQWLTEPASALAKSDITLTLQAGNAAPVTLRVDATTRRAAVSTDPAQFVLPGVLVEKLKEEFRNRTLIPVVAVDIVQTGIAEGSEKAAEFVRDPSSGLISLDGRKFEAGALNKLLEAIAGLRVERYRVGTDRSAVVRRITFKTAKGDEGTLSLLASGATVLFKGKFGGVEMERAADIDAASMKALRASLTTRPEAEPREND